MKIAETTRIITPNNTHLMSLKIELLEVESPDVEVLFSSTV